MNQFEAVVIVIVILVGVGWLLSGAFYLIYKLLWGIYLNFEAAQHAKAKKLLDVMEYAATLSLPTAIELLRITGIYYDVDSKWSHKHLRFPKVFWISTEYCFGAQIKAQALVTIATWEMNKIRDDNASRKDDWQKLEEHALGKYLFESLAFQGKKTPERVIAVVGLLAQQFNNTRLAVLLKPLENMGKYCA